MLRNRSIGFSSLLHMSVSLHALGLLAALASVVAAASLERRPLVVAAAGIAFAGSVGALWGPPAADPSAVGLVVAGLAILALFRRLHVLAAAVACGGLAGIWGDYLVGRGVPMWAAFGLAMGGPLLASYLAGNTRGFLPTYLWEESQVLLAALGVLVAVVPQLARGWQSASAMNFAPSTATTTDSTAPVANWVWPVLLAAAMGGAAFSLLQARWRERSDHGSDMV